MQMNWAQAYKLFLITLLSLALLVLLSPFVFPLALGGVLAVVVYPMYKKMLHLKLNKVLASFLTVTIFSLAFFVPTGILVYKGASRTAKFFVDTVKNEDWAKKLDFNQQKNLQKSS